MTSRTDKEQFTAPVSAGELLDKITILRIKQERITLPEKWANITAELEILEACAAPLLSNTRLYKLIDELHSINETLWDIEDDIRDCERQKDFGEVFVRLARNVYVTNDERARVKREINVMCGSRLIEEKSYASY